MKVKHRILDKLSRETQVPASTTTRRKKMTLRIRLLQKKLFTLPLVAVTTDLAIKK